MVTLVPPKVRGSGVEVACAEAVAKFEPAMKTMLPGASAPPVCGLYGSVVPLAVRPGTALGATDPETREVADGNPGAVASALTVTCAAACCGAHVPEYSPGVPFTGESVSGGSPLLKETTTCPFVTGAPQSVTSRMESGVGHDAATEKLSTNPTWTGTSCEGVQVTAWGELPPVKEEVVKPSEDTMKPAGSTTKPTFTT